LPNAQEISHRHYVDFLLAKNSELDGERILAALQFITEAHHDQYRKSGTPYIEHPLEVGKILTSLKLDTDTVIAGLLHDVVEDTQFSLDELQSRFGEQVAFMVDAVTKIGAAQAGSKEERKAQTYRKFLVSMAKDPRIIMIKLADRLHNLRTLNYMKPEKRKEIAKESLEIYAPLTHRFGLHRIKWEIEDLSLKNLDPEGYRSIIEKLQQTRHQRENYIAACIDPLQFKMALENLDCTIHGRPKHVYSIYQKTKSRNCSVDDLFDIFAIRIIVKTIPECYMALGYVHNLWQPLQSRFKDYIATPKPNLYQSLHTTLIGPKGKMVEVQIRTCDMEQTAENGFAAHWAYKLEASEDNLEWLQQMAKAQSEITDSKEFLEFLHLGLNPTQIVVFTPKGDSVSLPQGSTVLDFAFSVHTALGMHCIGAKVDGQVVGIDKQLFHGNTVHILRSNSQEPSQEWQNIVITHKARNALRKRLKSYMVEQAIRIGKSIYDREIQLLHIEEKQRPTPESICLAFAKTNVDEVYEALGSGNLAPGDLQQYLEAIYGPKRKESRLLSFFRARSEEDEEEPLLEIDPGTSPLLHVASCCTPVPGDRIAAISIPGKGMEIHKDGCRSLKNYSFRQIINAHWRSASHHQTSARFELIASDRDGLLDEISHILSKHQIRIEKATLVSVKENVRDRFTVKVYTLEQLELALQALRQIPGVKKVTRS